MLLLQEAHRGGLMGHFGVKKQKTSLLIIFLAQDAEGRGEIRCSLHNMPKS